VVPQHVRRVDACRVSDLLPRAVRRNRPGPGVR
jgi:hypothetical protein